MTTEQQRIDQYAALVVEVGANVQPGQRVVVGADIAHAPIARAVAERAYTVGAFDVHVEYTDAVVRRSALLHAPEAALTTATPWDLSRIEHWTAERIALIRLTGTPTRTCSTGPIRSGR